MSGLSSASPEPLRSEIEDLSSSGRIHWDGDMSWDVCFFFLFCENTVIERENKIGGRYIAAVIGSKVAGGWWDAGLGGIGAMGLNK